MRRRGIGRILMALGIGLAASLAAAGEGGPAPARVVKDGAGRRVRVPAGVARIVSLAPSITEMLFALEAGGRVVGVTDFCDHPAEAAGRTRIGGLINPDLETIVSLKPDLAIASTAGNYLEDAERLERLGIPVYTVAIPTVESMLASLLEVGDLIGQSEPARRLERSLRARLDQVRRSARDRPRMAALFVIEPDPLIAPGRSTFIGEALALAGADLVTAATGSSWNQLDLEQVLGMRPDVLLTTRINQAWARSLPGLPEWRRIPAVASGRVFVVSDSIQHPGPRLVEGIEEVSRLLEGLKQEEEPGPGASRREGGRRGGARTYRRASPSVPPPVSQAHGPCGRARRLLPPFTPRS